MGESADNGSAEEEQGIAGELDRSDVVNVSNITNDPNYDAQFTADNLEDRFGEGTAQNFMSPENFAQTTQGGASDPFALDDGFYNNVTSAFSGGAPLGVASPNAVVNIQELPSLTANNISFGQAQTTDQIYPDAILRLPEIRNNLVNNTVYPDAILRLPEIRNENVDSKKEEEDLANLAAQQAFSGAQVDDFARANLGTLPTPNIPDISGDIPRAGNLPTLDTDASDFNFSGSNAAQRLRDRARPTSGLLPLVDLVLGFPARRELGRLDQGFVPTFDDDGNIIGTQNISFGSNQTEGLLGQNPDLTNIFQGVQGMQTPTNVQTDDNGNQTVPPVTNPMTGITKCPEGYKFDEDLQACRVDTGSTGDSDEPLVASGDRFFRRSLLDTAPSNLPSGFDFDAANKQFTSRFALNPSLFNRPPQTVGFTPFSSFRPFNT